MSRANDSAFPELAHWDRRERNGMNVREVAAIAAMQGLLCGQRLYDGPEELAKDAIGCADALLAELEKSK